VPDAAGLKPPRRLDSVEAVSTLGRSLTCVFAKASEMAQRRLDSPHAYPFGRSLSEGFLEALLEPQPRNGVAPTRLPASQAVGLSSASQLNHEARDAIEFALVVDAWPALAKLEAVDKGGS